MGNFLRDFQQHPVNSWSQAIGLLLVVVFGVLGLKDKGWAVSADLWLVLAAVFAVLFVTLNTWRHGKIRRDLETRAQRAEQKATAAEAAGENAHAKALEVIRKPSQATQDHLAWLRSRSEEAERQAFKARAELAELKRLAQPPPLPAPKPLSAGEHAQVVRRINAARPVLKRLRQVFYKTDKKPTDSREFHSIFLDTALAMPEDKGPWDHYGWLLCHVLEKFVVNRQIEAAEVAFKAYEQQPTEDGFRNLAQSIADACMAGNSWLGTLMVTLNHAPKSERLNYQRDRFRRWMVGFNEFVALLLALGEEANDLGIPFFDGPFMGLAEKDGEFISRPNVHSG
ncbi:MAG: hypothetical protein LC623_08230 [Halobacteriales archaeon]|nr:hypothetical protein [Halobacteriales archaeon]